MSEILRRNDGARVIQFASGSMPTTSECACCDIMRMSCRRYRSGIQSFGSMLSPAAMRASKAATCAGSSATAVAALVWLMVEIYMARRPQGRTIDADVRTVYLFRHAYEASHSGNHRC